MCILHPTWVYENYMLDKGSKEANETPREYFHKSMNRNIFYSLIIYFFVLISHIVLSVPVLPLALFSIYRGMTGEISEHKRIVKWTFPIWMYVAITGVMVYLFMAPYY